VTVRPAAVRLNELLARAGLEGLEPGVADKFADYLNLLLRWNGRMNLSAIREEEGILSRHFVECIACARTLPTGLRTLLDFGSGAGFPGIPIALCRPELDVTLAESQRKKAAFLREASRHLGLAASVYAGRAESLPERFDCVALRAVDRMADAVLSAARLVKPGGWLVVMTTEQAWPEYVGLLAGRGTASAMHLAGSESGVIGMLRLEEPPGELSSQR
jgi:16S rRNA (guanine527-N7)-methyltransferase